jgi:hypothetical protein
VHVGNAKVPWCGRLPQRTETVQPRLGYRGRTRGAWYANSNIQREPTNGLKWCPRQDDIRGGRVRTVKMSAKDHAFTAIELMLVVATLGGCCGHGSAFGGG